MVILIVEVVSLSSHKVALAEGIMIPGQWIVLDILYKFHIIIYLIITKCECFVLYIGF